MKLVAKKPCSFGGRKFFIDQEIPSELVAEPAVQERLGVIAVVKEEEGLLAEELMDTAAFDGKVIVPVANKENGDEAEMMSIPLTGEEAQDVFTILQMNVTEAEKAINEVDEENVLIVLHACDSRSGVKKAAKNRADILITNEAETNAPIGGNEATGHTQETDNPSSD